MNADISKNKSRISNTEKIANKSIHSEEARECFKRHKIAEGISPFFSVSLTGPFKILSESQRDVSKSHAVSPKKIRNLSASLDKFIEQKHLEEKETRTEKHGRRSIELNLAR